MREKRLIRLLSCFAYFLISINAFAQPLSSIETNSTEASTTPSTSTLISRAKPPRTLLDLLYKFKLAYQYNFVYRDDFYTSDNLKLFFGGEQTWYSENENRTWDKACVPSASVALIKRCELAENKIVVIRYRSGELSSIMVRIFYSKNLDDRRHFSYSMNSIELMRVNGAIEKIKKTDIQNIFNFDPFPCSNPWGKEEKEKSICMRKAERPFSRATFGFNNKFLLIYASIDSEIERIRPKGWLPSFESDGF